MGKSFASPPFLLFRKWRKIYLKKYVWDLTKLPFSSVSMDVVIMPQE
jgi:hypothetical protein